ncbi:MAG: hypothetical protein QG657_5564 [Acidobacteriota bacterium]|nr:hypothetical protein [Acidobacteriota bacterium]
MKETSLTGLEIAVIGMICRFPGANNIDEFWDNLKNGVESISFFSDEELIEVGIAPGLLKDPIYIKAKGIIDDKEALSFDSDFFDYYPKEAAILNPQVRLLHECAWEALEMAGYVPGYYNGLIGLYIGATNSTMWEMQTYLSASESDAPLDSLSIYALADKDFLSTRLSYKLNLKGPAVNMQTACSTSLVTIHNACRALLTGECDMALAGGATVNIPQKSGYIYTKEMIFSPDGHCRAFDAKAKGTVGGNGVGIVVLKRLNNAIADGDEIYALIKGSAINNDGNRKVGYTAPSVEGQMEVIKAAQQMAEVEFESITYIEAHGTGTPLGDPVEIEALKKAFNTGKKRFCAVGSVKTNVGHLDSAAGVAGFIKTVLALKNKQIPPSLHYETPNPKIDFDNSPFYVNATLQAWQNDVYPLRAGVSSFGIGGTNAHVILEEAPKNFNKTGSTPLRSNKLILVSAKSEPILNRMIRNLGQFFQKNPNINLDNVAYTLQVGRSSFKYRKMFVCSTLDEAVNILSAPDSDKIHSFYVKEEIRPVIFMFPGQGAQYVNMGLDIYHEELLFKEILDHCFDILNKRMGLNLKTILYPEEGENATVDIEAINRTEITQPLIFIIEYALARLLMKWGIKPHAMIGHSIGEYVAACLAGVFSLEDALEIVALRGRFMQQMPCGAMLGVQIPTDEINTFLTTEIELAAVNGALFCVVSGPTGAINQFKITMKEKGYKTTPLHTSHAFHSNMMEPILKDFAKELAKFALNKPGIPYISNLTGTWITIEDAVNPAYWSMHLRRTVKFSAGLNELLKVDNSIFIEVGPGTTLSTFVRHHPAKTNEHQSINLIRHPQENIPDARYLLHKLGQLWFYGKKIDWLGFYGEEKRNRIPLPTYPFQRRQYPFKAKSFQSILQANTDVSSIQKKDDISKWFYIPVWEKSIYSMPVVPVETSSVETALPLTFLVFMDIEGWCLPLVQQLSEKGHRVILVKIGTGQIGYKKDSEKLFFINPEEENDYRNLFKELREMGKLPDRILHFWSISSTAHPLECPGDIERLQNLGYYSLTGIARAIGNEAAADKIQIKVFTNNIFSVTGEEELHPWNATVLGPVKVIPLEYPNIDCSIIDISLPTPGMDKKDKEEKLMHLLAIESVSNGTDVVVAIRSGFRCRQMFKTMPFDMSEIESTRPPRRLREQGVYLITGGLGGIGLTLAGRLAKTVKARLILVGRSPFPARQEWGNLLKLNLQNYENENKTGHKKEKNIVHKIRKLLELEENGAQILIKDADIANSQQMRDIIEQAEWQYGPVNGIIHSAGIPDGAIIQRSTRAMSESIFNAKIKGTQVLDLIFKDKSLDFFIICSSLNSLIPTFGQAAYCSANAFIDAFAYYKNTRDGIFTASINWDAWEEIGMSFEARQRSEIYPNSRTVSTPHPFVEKCISEDTADVYIGNLGVRKNWALDEHRIFDKATFPGTAYVEMIRAVFQAHVGDVPMEIKDIYFLQPLVMEDDEEREVRTILKKNEQGFEFFITSRAPAAKDKLLEHARGKIDYLQDNTQTRHSLHEIEVLCSEKEVNLPPGIADEGEKYLKFGPRWNIGKQVKQGIGQALIVLELPGEFGADLNTYKLHPALLDNALAGTFGAGSYYLPFSYKKVKIRKPFTSKIFSYIRLKENKESPKEFKHFSVILMDGEGNELVNISEYTLMQVPIERIQMRDISDSSSPMRPTDFANEREPGFDRKENTEISYGIKPAEGVEIFERILAETYPHPQVVISTIDFDARVDHMKKLNILGRNETDEEKTLTNIPLISQQRPELSTRYVEPSTGMEKKIADIFQKFMGIKEIGINDNFFELGANSLMMVQLNSQLEKAIEKEVSIVTIYAHPTIKDLARFLSNEKQSPADSEEEVESMKQKIEKGKSKLDQRKQRNKGMRND